MRKSLYGIVLFWFASIANAAPIIGANGNAYEYISSTGITWFDADNEASLSFYNGVNGHLASVFDQDENDFILSLLTGVNGSVWLGGSDAFTEGAWKWVADDNYQFWDGGIAGVNGWGGYANWVSRKEPNNENNEDYASMFGGAVGIADGMYAPGLWNDLSYDQTGSHATHSAYSMLGYVVEYNVSAVPIPPAVWLFSTGLIALIGIAKRKAS